MEQQRGALTGSGTTSDKSTKQEEETPLMQQRVVAVEKLKVMVALDESDGSFYALNWALKNLLTPKISFGPISGDIDESVGLHDEQGCMLYLVHVQNSFQSYVYPAGPGLHTAAFAASSVVESVRKAQAEISATILERALTFCRHSKVRAETLILEGDPKEEICKAIEQTHVDMLVIGSRGLGQIKRAFLGSVSDYCAHHASCPVLIVKPPKDAYLSTSSK
ncbi:hypothetical protein RND81_06G197600 [Saponaria officinalis]|uniref:UspA domain-containing protein n=1 Tax=Saponaria officinalis TaxID=3572 RepID=A0AAW1KDM8_SAPOF